MHESVAGHQKKMTRKKVKFMWIVNDAARKASLKKRRIGLLKKVSELAALCDVSAFAIVYSPDDGEPMMWPTRPEVEQLLIRYQSISAIGRCKKMMNQEIYLKERIAKLQEQCRKQEKKTRAIEFAYFMDQLHNGHSIDDLEVNQLQQLIWLVEERLKDVSKRSGYFKMVPPPAPGFFPLPSHGGHITESMGRRGGGGSNGDMICDQCFINMVNKNENIAGGSSGTKDDIGYPLGCNIIGSGSPGAGGVDMGLSLNGNPFGQGLEAHDNFTGSSSRKRHGDEAACSSKRCAWLKL